MYVLEVLEVIQWSFDCSRREFKDINGVREVVQLEYNRVRNLMDFPESTSISHLSTPFFLPVYIPRFSAPGSIILREYYQESIHRNDGLPVDCR